MRLLLVKTWRDLRAAGAQTAALVVVAALGIASLVALVGAYEDLSASYERTYRDLAFADVTWSVETAPASVVSEVGAVPGVAAAAARLVVDAGLQLPDGERARARVIGVAPEPRPAVNDVLVESGRWLRADDGRSVVVERHFAATWDVQPGETMSVLLGGSAVRFDVVGTGASPEYLAVIPSRQEIVPSPRTFAVLFAPLTTLQRLVAAEGRVNDVAIRLEPGADRTEVMGAVGEVLAPYRVIEATTRDQQPSNAGLKLDLEGYRELAVLMPALILMAAALSVYVLIGRLVLAQRPQIGLMRALGWSGRDVLAHYLVFALAIGVAGAVAGAVAGLLLASAVTRAYAQELGIPLVETHVHPEVVAAAVIVSLAVAALGGLGPARASAAIDPALAMRLDPAGAPAVPTRRALGAALPLWIRLPLRNALRMRWRSLSTVLAMVFAAVLVLASWGLGDSMSYLLDRHFNDVERWDLRATFAQPQDAGVLASVRAVAGVGVAEGELLLPATLRAHDRSSDVLLTALSSGQRLHAILDADGVDRSSAIGGGRVVLAPAQLSKLALAVGDRVRVETPAGGADLVVSAAAGELGAVAYVSLDDAASIVGTPAAPINAVLVSATGDARSVESGLYELPSTGGVLLKADEERDWRSLMSFFYVFVGVIVAFAVAMAFALLFNATTINVLERLRELATMRALGAGAGEIAGLIAVEHVLLWTAAVVPGLVLGRLVADQMGAAFTSDLFSLRIVIAPVTYVLVAAGILATTLLAAVPAVRRVAALDLARSTKVHG